MSKQDGLFQIGGFMAVVCLTWNHFPGPKLWHPSLFFVTSGVFLLVSSFSSLVPSSWKLLETLIMGLAMGNRKGKARKYREIGVNALFLQRKTVKRREIWQAKNHSHSSWLALFAAGFEKVLLTGCFGKTMTACRNVLL